jgi:hypothetical protein
LVEVEETGSKLPESDVEVGVKVVVLEGGEGVVG